MDVRARSRSSAAAAPWVAVGEACSFGGAMAAGWPWIEATVGGLLYVVSCTGFNRVGSVGLETGRMDMERVGSSLTRRDRVSCPTPNEMRAESNKRFVMGRNGASRPN